MLQTLCKHREAYRLNYFSFFSALVTTLSDLNRVTRKTKTLIFLSANSSVRQWSRLGESLEHSLRPDGYGIACTEPGGRPHGCKQEGFILRGINPHIQRCWDTGALWAQRGQFAQRELRVL